MLYEDEDKSRKAELAAVAGPNEFAEFYSRLKSLKDAHRRNPDEVVVVSIKTIELVTSIPLIIIPHLEYITFSV